MPEKELYAAIIRPFLTERSTILKEKYNQYVFEVSLGASKPMIKQAVSSLFKVTVEDVRTMIVRGKFHRFGKGGNFRADWKKAIVTLAKGQKIDFTEKTA